MLHTLELLGPFSLRENASLSTMPPRRSSRKRGRSTRLEEEEEIEEEEEEEAVRAPPTETGENAAHSPEARPTKKVVPAEHVSPELEVLKHETLDQRLSRQRAEAEARGDVLEIDDDIEEDDETVDEGGSQGPALAHVQALFRPPNPPSPILPPAGQATGVSDETEAAVAEAVASPATERVAEESSNHISNRSSNSLNGNEGNSSSSSNSSSDVISLVSPEERNSTANASSGSSVAHSNRARRRGGGAGVGNGRVVGRNSSGNSNSNNAWDSWDINDLVKLPVSVLFNMRPELQRGSGRGGLQHGFPSNSQSHSRLHHALNGSSSVRGASPFPSPHHLPVNPQDRAAVLAMRMAHEMAAQRGGGGYEDDDGGGYGGSSGSSERRSHRLDIPLTSLSSDQRRAVDLALNRQSLFFTGSAGTGKSTCLKAMISTLRDAGRSVAVTASTGAAALLVEGSTLHSWAGVGLGNDPVPKLIGIIKRSQQARSRWKTTDVLIVDECSMLDPILFDKLNQIAKDVRADGRGSSSMAKKPFGGIQLILCGDFAQLPPVQKGGSSAAARFLFQAKSWSECVQQQVLLRQAFRQSGDTVFAKLLDEIRVGAVTHASRLLLEKAASHDLSNAAGIEPTRLYARNMQVDDENRERLRILPGAMEPFQGEDWGTTPREVEKLDKNCLWPHLLELKVGAQVMLLKNLDVDAGLANGSRGVVVSLPRAGPHSVAASTTPNNGGKDDGLGGGTATNNSLEAGATANASKNASAAAARILEAAKSQVEKEDRDERSGSGEKDKSGGAAADDDSNEANKSLQESSGDMSSGTAVSNESSTITSSSNDGTTNTSKDNTANGSTSISSSNKGGSGSKSSSGSNSSSSNSSSSSTTEYEKPPGDVTSSSVMDAKAMEVIIEDSDGESEAMDYLHMHGNIEDVPREPAIEVQFLDGQRRFITRDALEMKDGNDKVVARRVQFPLRLAWAMTIHKSQGQTCDLLEVDLAGCFEDGQAYTALSRATALSKMRVANFRRSCVRAAAPVVAFLQNLIRESGEEPPPLPVSCSCAQCMATPPPLAATLMPASRHCFPGQTPQIGTAAAAQADAQRAARKKLAEEKKAEWLRKRAAAAATTAETTAATAAQPPESQQKTFSQEILSQPTQPLPSSPSVGQQTAVSPARPLLPPQQSPLLSSVDGEAAAHHLLDPPFSQASSSREDPLVELEGQAQPLSQQQHGFSPATSTSSNRSQVGGLSQEQVSRMATNRERALQQLQRRRSEVSGTGGV